MKPPQEFDLVCQPDRQTSLHQTFRRWPRLADTASSPSKPLSPQSDATSGNAEQNLDKLLEAAGILVWEAEAESFAFTYVSEQALKLVGYPLEHWYQPDFFASHVHPDDRERVFAICQTPPQPDQHYDFEFRMLAKTQHIVWFRNVVEIVHGDDERCRMRGFMIDITHKKRVEEVLRELGGRLISAQEEERSRVARELHDDLNQRMAVLSIQLEQLQQDLRKPLDTSLRFQSLKKQVQEISNDIHRLSYRLHPSKLDHLGLGAAVKSLCDELKQSGKLEIEFQQTGVPASLPQDVTLCVFRIAQEALRNCIKHSGARAVDVVLKKTNNEIHLSVSDDGCGFDPESELSRKGLGFISMRERLRLVDGCMRVDTRPFEGTRVEVSVPVTCKVERMPLRDTCDRKPTTITKSRQVLTGGWRSYETNTRSSRG